MCHRIETFPLIFAFKGIYNLMITIRLPAKPTLITEQCHKGVTVGQGEDNLVLDVTSMYVRNLPMVWLMEKIPMWWWVFPVVVTLGLLL